MLTALLEMASPAGSRARLSTLIFHRVLSDPDPLFPEQMHARRFDEMCDWIKRWFTVLSLDEAVTRLHSGSLPARALAITFDDGYADNRHVALPILTRHRLPATFFVATGFLDGGLMWNDAVIESVRANAQPVMDLRDLLGEGVGVFSMETVTEKRSAIDAIIGSIKYVEINRRAALVDEIAERAGARLPTDLMLRSPQVREMRDQGMQIGAHTVSHPILACVDRDTARSEMRESKRFLEDLLDEAVTLFAYPNGKPLKDFNADSVEIAREVGFHAATSTAWGAATCATDPFQIPRFTPWDRTRGRFGARMLTNLWARRAREV